jgi:hypothetical protein
MDSRLRGNDDGIGSRRVRSRSNAPLPIRCVSLRPGRTLQKTYGVSCRGGWGFDQHAIAKVHFQARIDWEIFLKLIYFHLLFTDGIH